ncbi:hypothetical protein Bca52824_058840 [Brassica carinata]|uniref:Uncharacterized protein n=1 Tax=Brassica carinata TaxID=52824 RepID=A0A8X7UE37_BRACI|nr:hypothetical protein Bca52824_058840 [Brassica carinata]
MLCSRFLTPVVRILLGGIIRLLTPVVSLSPWRNHPALVRYSPTSIDLCSDEYWSSFLEFRSRVELAIMFRLSLVLWYEFGRIRRLNALVDPMRTSSEKIMEVCVIVVPRCGTVDSVFSSFRSPVVKLEAVKRDVGHV